MRDLNPPLDALTIKRCANHY